MTLTDTHCHLDMDRFDPDRQAVVERALACGVRRILVPALNYASALHAIALAESHPDIFAAVGYHPTDLADRDELALEHIQELSSHPKVVAVGEVGLDYFWVTDHVKRNRQREALSAQLNLAQRIHRPVVLHLREQKDSDSGECSRDLLSILESWISGMRSEKDLLASAPGVLHSFSGSLETAQSFIQMGFYIGITGPITYGNAEKRRQLVIQLPLERLLIETDAPFMTPEPHRGQRNEPAFVKHIADKIAQIRSCTPREVADVTTANAARLFAWGEPV